MKQRTVRVVLDVLLSVLLVFEMFIQYTGGLPHEIGGAAFFVLVALHLALSATWIGKTSTSLRAHKLSGRRKRLAVMGCLLALSMAVLGVSSVAISDVLWSAGFVWPLGPYEMWESAHAVSSYALCALVVVHLAMHWSFLASAFKIPYNPARREAIGASVHTAASFVAVSLGATAINSAFMQKIEHVADLAAAEQTPADPTPVIMDTQRAPSTESVDVQHVDATTTDEQTAAAPTHRGEYSAADTTSQDYAQATEEPIDVSVAEGDGYAYEEPVYEEPVYEEPAYEEPVDQGYGAAPVGICTLCRKRCSLDAPRCDKPYAAGLL